MTTTGRTPDAAACVLQRHARSMLVAARRRQRSRISALLSAKRLQPGRAHLSQNLVKTQQQRVLELVEEEKERMAKLRAACASDVLSDVHDVVAMPASPEPRRSTHHHHRASLDEFELLEAQCLHDDNEADHLSPPRRSLEDARRAVKSAALRTPPPAYPPSVAALAADLDLPDGAEPVPALSPDVSAATSGERSRGRSLDPPPPARVSNDGGAHPAPTRRSGAIAPRATGATDQVDEETRSSGNGPADEDGWRRWRTSSTSTATPPMPPAPHPDAGGGAKDGAGARVLSASAVTAHTRRALRRTSPSALDSCELSASLEAAFGMSEAIGRCAGSGITTTATVAAPPQVTAAVVPPMTMRASGGGVRDGQAYDAEIDMQIAARRMRAVQAAPPAAPMVEPAGRSVSMREPLSRPSVVEESTMGTGRDDMALAGGGSSVAGGGSAVAGDGLAVACGSSRVAQRASDVANTVYTGVKAKMASLKEELRTLRDES